ncbi:molybdopterin converting factor subunit 1 [Marinobacter confluentis]|uniref:Molybdopterin synthase sulfur carrier subunit n=1 Tax=Marinobacter confluentis TaxID=1697557 RepID=A0A4Z1C4R4_9GAMM|nr:molybdopterin converting factor subunit 1 [Marinobacter confluentis]TGN38052.1 molybdopterin converting factor subunit 1 [Marinobacter confluentis]
MTEALSDTFTVRFFARLREELGVEEMTLKAEPGLTTGRVLEQLASRGGPWSQLKNGQPVMIAVNQAMAKEATAVNAGDELAFFPPVTGG